MTVEHCPILPAAAFCAKRDGERTRPRVLRVAPSPQTSEPLGPKRPSFHRGTENSVRSPGNSGKIPLKPPVIPPIPADSALRNMAVERRPIFPALRAKHDGD